MIISFQKNFQIKIYQKISETRVIKKMITIPLTLATKQQFSIKPRRRLLGSRGWKNLKKMTISIKHEDCRKFFKKMLKVVKC